MKALFILTCFICCDIYTQQPVLEWAARYTGSTGYEQYITDTYTDSTGNTYICGYIQLPNQANSKDWLVLKISTSGNIQWTKTYNGPADGEDEAAALDVDRMGNVYVSGHFTNTSTWDFLTIKLNKDGDTLWTRKFDAANNLDKAVDIGIDASGSVYITGYSYFPGPNADFATIKYDTTGNLIWAKYFGGISNLTDLPSKLVIDNNNNVVVAGTIRRNLSKSDVVTIKYDSNGEMLWNKMYSGVNSAGADFPRNMEIDQSDNIYLNCHAVNDSIKLIKYNPFGDSVYIVTFSDSIGNFRFCLDTGNIYLTTGVSGASVRSDCYTAKYSSNGAFVWSQRFAGNLFTSDDSGKDIAIDKSGNVYVAGHMDSNRIAYDFLTIKYNANGVLQWYKRYSLSTFADDKASYIGLDSSANIYVTGISSGQITTVKYSQPPLGIINIGNEISTEYKIFQNYPNPFNPSTTIRYQVAKNSFIEIQVYDVLGRRISKLVSQKQNAGVYEASFESFSIASGLYFYTFIADGKIIDIRKMLVIK